MKNKNRPKRPRYKPFLYRGVIRCGECGGFITMEEQKGHNYLRCTKKKGKCSQRYLREEKIAEQIASQIRRVALSDGWAAWLFEKNDLAYVEEVDASHKHKERLQQELAQCETRLNRLTDVLLDDVISHEDYKRFKNELIPKRRQLWENIEVVEANAVFWLEPFSSWWNSFVGASRLLANGFG
jgi:site-specific DNA recombinase